MLKGEAWSHSKQKRLIDVSIGVALAPLSGVIETVSPAAFGPDAKDYPALLASERVGQLSPTDKFATFVLYKIRTGAAETGPAFNNLAQLMRSAGLDEIGQYVNLLNGTMSLRGHRPVFKDHLERVYDEVCDGALVDRHRNVVMSKKPGVISSFGIASHLHTAGNRLEMDIKDEIDGSFRYDFGLVTEYAKSCLRTVLKKQPT